MNTLLTIQVKVAAREAQAALKQLIGTINSVNSASAKAGNKTAAGGVAQQARASSAELRKLNANLLELKGQGTFTSLGRQADAFAKKVENINRNLKRGMSTGPGWQQPAGMGASANVQRGQAAAATAEVRASEAQKREAFRQTAAINKQTWNQQIREARAASAVEREEAKKTQTYMKQIWNEQVRDYKAAKKKQEEAAKQLAAAERAAAGTSGVAGAAQGTNGLNALGRLSLKVNGEVNKSRLGMIAMGKDMQWVGRQINFNFTIPLLLAGRSAMTWALDAEAAFVRVQKVYGESGKDYTDELERIKYALRLLSDMYGVSAAQVNELAAQWAAAGAKGGDLAQAVKTSLDLSILGDYKDLGDVFKQLITIQGAYKMSAGELQAAIALLNTTENMSAATLPDLVTGIARAGGAAQAAGVDIRHLSAMMAALVPSTGSAANAGNALKTILARLMAPTEDTIDVLRAMGIEFYETDFQMRNGAERIELLAEKFQGLTDAQQANAASIIGSRYQYNKLLVLLQDLNSEESKYKEVLAALAPGNDDKNFKQASDEIKTLLESSPRKLQIVTNMIKNQLIDAITPMIPVLTGMLQMIRGIFEWFGNLPVGVQKATMMFLGLVVIVGVLAQALGSIQLLFGTFIRFAIFAIGMIPGISLGASTTAGAIAASTAATTGAIASQTATLVALIQGEAAATTAAVAGAAEAQTAIVAAASTAQVGIVAKAAAAIVGILTSPWTLAVLAIIAAFAVIFLLVYKFQDQVVRAMNWVSENFQKAWNAFPEIVANALMAVLRIVESLIKQIMKWLSYLNPFARHSPSLVDNVTAGVDVILKQYARLSGIGQIFAKAASDLEKFAKATAAANAASKKLDRADTKSKIVANSPGAGPSVDALFVDLDLLNAKLVPLAKAIAEQEAVVRPLELAYNLAANAVEQFEAQMAPLVALVEDLSNQIDAANDKIKEFASTNIIGMKAAADATFANEMAQKALRLELLKMGPAGEGYDEIQKKIAEINGDIENLRGTMTDLRQAGAGSDVLATYNQQLDALEAQKDSLVQSAQNGSSLTQQLAELQHQADIMDLETSLQFDPLLRQIDDLANATKELSFEEIMAGIKDQKGIVAKLTVEYDKNKAALDKQQKVLDKLIQTRDIMKQKYDIERTKLEGLKIQYQAIEDQIRAIEDALKTAATSSDALSKAAAGAGDSFSDLTGQFEDIPLPTFEDGSSLEDLIAEWEKKSKEMFKFDPFEGIKKWWKSTEKWLGEKGLLVVNWVLGIVGWFQSLPLRIAGLVLTMYNKAKEIIGGFMAGIGAKAVEIWAWFAALPTRIGGLLVLAGWWLYDKGSALIGGFLRGVGVKALELWTWFTNLPGKIKGYFLGAVSWLWQTGVDLVQGLINGASSMVSKLTKVIIDALPKPSDLVPGPAGWVLQIAGAEQGAIINKEMIIRVGEGNKPEAIIPLTNDVRAMQIMRASGLIDMVQRNARNLNQPMAVSSMGGPTLTGGGGSVNAKTIIINGDISLPNITSPEDAEKFLANIEALAGI